MLQMTMHLSKGEVGNGGREPQDQKAKGCFSEGNQTYPFHLSGFPLWLQQGKWHECISATCSTVTTSCLQNKTQTQKNKNKKQYATKDKHQYRKIKTKAKETWYKIFLLY